MRLLKFNNTKVDIDDQTAIGIDFQCYDVKNPANRKVNVTNTFSIPKTSNNINIIGQFGNVHYDEIVGDLSVYNTILCDYYVDNEHLIKATKVRIEEVGERIECFTYEKLDVWDSLKDYYWNDFVSDYFNWLVANDYIWHSTNVYIGTFTDFITALGASTEHAKILYFVSNLYNQVDKEFPNNFVEKELELWTKYRSYENNIDANGGHILFFIKSIFQFIEYKYSVNWGVSETFSYNVFNDAYVNKICVPVRNILAQTVYTETNYTISDTQNDVKVNVQESLPFYSDVTKLVVTCDYNCQFYASLVAFGDGDIVDNYTILANTPTTITLSFFAKDIYYQAYVGTINNITLTVDTYFYDVNDNQDFWWLTLNSNSIFAPLNDVQDKNDRTLYDFVNSFMQHFNVIKDEVFENGSYKTKFYRLDDLRNADHINWSGNLSGQYTVKPMIEGYAQKNVIKFKSIYEQGDSMVNSRTITCYNQNIDKKVDLFEIDAHIPAIVAIPDNKFVIDISTKESFKTFEFIICSGTSSTFPVRFFHQDYSTNRIQTSDLSFELAAIYDLTGEYQLIASMIAYPIFYKVKKWVKISEIRNLQFFKKYFIKELGGSFFLNKISGYNPEKSNEPTDLELILIDRTTPDMRIITGQNYVDGLNNAFIDGLGNNFIWQ